MKNHSVQRIVQLLDACDRGNRAVLDVLMPPGKALKVSEDGLKDFLVLDEAPEQWATFDQRKSRMAELQVFGRLTVEKIAEALSISPTTVRREWRLAKVWL